MEIRIVSPSGQNVPFNTADLDRPEGVRVTYMPQEAGAHLIYLNFGAYDVPHCPVEQLVLDSAMPAVYGDGLYRGEEDVPATFEVDARGLRGDLFVQVDGPNSIAKCTFEPQPENGVYSVTYMPVEVGVYNLHVKWNDKNIDGSPFHPSIVNPRKVVPVDGWPVLLDVKGRIGLITRQIKQIDFDCTQAGPGELQAEVTGPGGLRVPAMLSKVAEGVYSLSFTPEQEGDYLLHLYFGEVPLPESPIPMVAVRPEPKVDPSQVVLSGDYQEAIVNEQNVFTIDGSRAGNGKPGVRLTGPFGEVVETQLEPLGNQRYRCFFKPQNAGAHLLVVTWENKAIAGSPFRMQAVLGSDPSKVHCYGDGLQYGELGKENSATIDVRQAGPGELTASCVGPTGKPAFCQLFDHQDATFTLGIRPQEAGRHVLSIKFAGQHVPGSPFSVNVHGPPDPSKVIVYGPGVEHGVLSSYESRFICETKGAGAGQLTVKVRGPKGAFRVEMSREHPRDRTIVCRYDPVEPGDYVISVKWAGEHVRNSPFYVQIFETDQELSEFLRQTGQKLRNGLPPFSRGVEA